MTEETLGQLSPAERARYRVATQARPIRRWRRWHLPPVRAQLRAAIAAVDAWQSDIPDQGRVVLVGLILLAIGLALSVGLAAGLIASSIVLVLVGLGFDFRHYATATALVIAVGLVLVVAIVRVS